MNDIWITSIVSVIVAILPTIAAIYAVIFSRDNNLAIMELAKKTAANKIIEAAEIAADKVLKAAEVAADKVLKAAEAAADKIIEAAKSTTRE